MLVQCEVILGGHLELIGISFPDWLPIVNRLFLPRFYPESHPL